MLRISSLRGSAAGTAARLLHSGRAGLGGLGPFVGLLNPAGLGVAGDAAPGHLPRDDQRPCVGGGSDRRES